jgi:hypothetical protein
MAEEFARRDLVNRIEEGISANLKLNSATN